MFSIEQMPNGDIWASILDHGIFKYLPDVDGFQQFVDDPELADNTVNTFKAQGEHWLWVGTDAGLSLMDTKTEELTRIQEFGVKNKQSDNAIETINIYGGYA